MTAPRPEHRPEHRLERRFEWRGRTVAWDRRGSGPAVVMCHGTPWSSALWKAYADALSHEYTVYLWDMPGYGQSSKHPEHPVDLASQGELLADLLEHWSLDAPHLLVHDFGGAVALRAHLLHGATYASMALVDVVALRPWGSDMFRLIAQNADAFTAQPRVVHRGALEAYIGTASYIGLTSTQLATLTEPWLTDDGQPAFYRQIAQADERHTDEVEGRYADLDLPVKVIWGREDTWIPLDRATRLAETIPDAELEVIDGAGHLVHYDAPVRLSAALCRWLARVG